MATTRSKWPHQVRTAAGQWLAGRKHELTHCHACDAPTQPLGNVCQQCGQQSPSKLAPSAALCLVACFALLATLAAGVLYLV